MMQFSNDSSQCLFIGNRNLKQVIEQDQRELAEIGGSFSAIAGRMQELRDYADKKGYFLSHDELSGVIDPILRDFISKYGQEFHTDPNAWKEYKHAWAKAVANSSRTWYDDKVAILQILHTRGFQPCPFGCHFVWSEDVEIASRKSERNLTINRGTVHLAREHNLLEKDNEYGISAREFYEHFM
jgi:hypothetical protein